MRAFLVGLLVALLSSSLRAQEPAIVRSSLPVEEAWAGQRVDFTVELLVPFRFSGTPRFDLPKLDGAVLMRTSTRPVLGTASVGRESYVSALHSFALYFQRAGEFVVPPFDVRFEAIAAFGEDPVAHVLPTSEHRVEVSMPLGAESLRTIFATEEFTFEQSWEPELPGEGEEVAAGAAFVRTIRMSASDVPGLLLPELALESVDGLEAYPEAPSVNTDQQRGRFLGTRVERVTYVCVAGGDVVLPEQTVRWWNSETETLESTEIAGARFRVAAAPVVDAAEAEPARSDDATSRVLGLALLAVGFAAVDFARVRLKRRSSRGASETERTWESLRRALRGEDPAEALTALYAWLAATLPRGESVSLRSLRTASEALSVELERLERCYVEKSAWSGERLASELERLRHAREHASRHAAARLPGLNPDSPSVARNIADVGTKGPGA